MTASSVAGSFSLRVGARRSFVGALGLRAQLAALVAACSSGPTAPLTADRPLYVANNGSITVYGAGDTGNSAPLATIAGSNTRLYSPFNIARDKATRLYVAPRLSDSITIYAPGATGNAAPIATIAGTSTGLASPPAVAFDAAGRLYIANQGDTITIYAPGATGNASPVARIAGNSTGLNGADGLAFDAHVLL